MSTPACGNALFCRVPLVLLLFISVLNERALTRPRHRDTAGELAMPEAMVGSFIGKGGKAITKFQSDYRVEVDLIRAAASGGTARLLLSGTTAEEVAAAAATIEAAIEVEAARQGEMPIEDPVRHHRRHQRIRIRDEIGAAATLLVT